LMARLENTNSWQAALHKLTLPPVSRENINEWLRRADNWTSHAAGLLGALRSAALEQLLLCETLIASHARSGQPIAAAPAACKVPYEYGILMQGGERKRKTSLDWWARFQRADGWLAGGARLAVAGSVVVGVLGMGTALGTSTVLVYNGLSTPVRVTIDGHSKLVEPGQHTLVQSSVDADHTVQAHMPDGRLLESFSPHDGAKRSVYNIGSASIMVTYVARYDEPGDEQNLILGAPRWFETDADVVFEQPPHSVNTESKKWRKVLATANGLDADPLSMWNNVKDPEQRMAMLTTHARWDSLEKAPTFDWLKIAAEEGAGDILAQRLKESPEHVQLRRVEQDVANDSPEVCAAARERSQARPDDGNRLYLALRCEDEPSEEEIVAAQARFPDNSWLVYLQAQRLLSLGAWQEALEPLRKVQGKLPLEKDELEMELERTQRLVDGDVISRKVRTGPQLARYIRLENVSSSPYSALVQGDLGKAMAVAKADPAQAVRVRMLVAASDGATAAQVQVVLDEPKFEWRGSDAVIMSALAMRYGRDADPYWAQAKGLGQYPPKLRRFVEAAQAGKYMEAEQELGTLRIELRALAYCAGVIVAGPGAPARWRRTARLGLFAVERPYLRS
jgi:hypothetical protein